MSLLQAILLIFGVLVTLRVTWSIIKYAGVGLITCLHRGDEWAAKEYSEKDLYRIWKYGH